MKKIPRFLFCLFVFTAFFPVLLPACSLFDNTKLEQQRAEIARLKEETEKLKQEADALHQQNQQADQEREACNRAFSAFDQGRKAVDADTAIASYKEGLSLCPNDDVAHNELGEIYLRRGRKAEAKAEFQTAVQINPNFSRAQKNLDAAQ